MSGQVSALQDSSARQSSEQQKIISELQSKVDETKSALTLSQEKAAKVEAFVTEKANKIEALQQAQTKLEADLQTKVGSKDKKKVFRLFFNYPSVLRINECGSLDDLQAC